MARNPAIPKMKKDFLFVIAVSLLIIPAIARCDHLLYLTNGDSISVPRYWLMGNHIKFEYLGGTIKIPASRVDHISELANNPYTHSAGGGIPRMLLPGPINLLSTETGAEKSGFRKTGSVLSVDLEAYDLKQDLRNRLQEGLERFKRASMNRDAAGKNEAIEDMSRISQRLSRLR